MIRKAIPTEYDGVKFDSKSEAVFARIMDLSGIDWERQHPISHEGHDWDFLVWAKDFEVFTAFPNGYDRDGGCRTFMRETLKPCLIELKPSEPTESYIKRLEVGHGSPQNERRIVVWGNPWDTSNYWVYEYREFIWDKTWTKCVPLGYDAPAFQGVNNTNYIKEAVGYRFDLKCDSQMFSLPHRKTKDIKLIARLDEPGRIERLKKVVEYIKNRCPKILDRISSLEDHKGNLTCVWVQGCSRIGNGKTTVENAWESVDESACSVTHEFI